MALALVFGVVIFVCSKPRCCIQAALKRLRDQVNVGASSAGVGHPSSGFKEGSTSRPRFIISKEWTRHATHILVNGGESISPLALLGLMSDQHVVSAQWALDCSKEGRFLAEDKYEVSQSTTSCARLRGELFKGLLFLLPSPSADAQVRDHEILTQILTVGGARVFMQNDVQALCEQGSQGARQCYLIANEASTLQELQGCTAQCSLPGQMRLIAIRAEWVVESVCHGCLAALDAFAVPACPRAAS